MACLNVRRTIHALLRHAERAPRSSAPFTPCRESPTLISTLWCAGIVAIDSGDEHSVALSADGRLWTWGNGKHGALGHDSLDVQSVPREVESLRGSPVVSMAAGGQHTVALTARGRVYAWGNNGWGQLGVGNRIDASVPCMIEGSHTMHVLRVRPRSAALPWMCARSPLRRRERGVRVQVSAGSRHTLLESTSGVVFGCGCSESGQLGAPCVAQGCVVTPSPVPIQEGEPGRKPALAVACGDHTLLVCCPEKCLPGCRAKLHACNTAIAIPDLLALAKAARPLSGDAVALQDHSARSRCVQALTSAIRNVFSSPGLLVSGFSIPPAPRAAYDAGLPTESQHNLDLDAIKEVYESILLVLETDVVLALQSTIATLLQRIFQKEDLSAAQGTVSALSQARWLKVRCPKSLVDNARCAGSPAHTLVLALCVVS